MTAPHRTSCIRLFVALFPPPLVQREIGLLKSIWRWPEEQWFTEPHRLHLTLLDPVEATEAQAQALREQMRTLAFVPLALEFRIVEARGGTVVLLAEPDAGLKKLQQVLRSMALRAGLRMPQAHPHITLVRRGGDIQPGRMLRPIHWTAETVSLTWSKLWPQYPRREYVRLLECQADASAVAGAAISHDPDAQQDLFT